MDKTLNTTFKKILSLFTVSNDLVNAKGWCLKEKKVLLKWNFFINPWHFKCIKIFNFKTQKTLPTNPNDNTTSFHAISNMEINLEEICF